jgi:hypothetical protein
MTWADLIAAVRAQIDVSDVQAYEWLLDRARVMNAEAAWLLDETGFSAADGRQRRDRPLSRRRPRRPRGQPAVSV